MLYEENLYNNAKGQLYQCIVIKQIKRKNSANLKKIESKKGLKVGCRRCVTTIRL